MLPRLFRCCANQVVPTNENPNTWGNSRGATKLVHFSQPVGFFWIIRLPARWRKFHNRSVPMFPFECEIHKKCPFHPTGLAGRMPVCSFNCCPIFSGVRCVVLFGSRKSLVSSNWFTIVMSSIDALRAWTLVGQQNDVRYWGHRSGLSQRL